MKRIDGLIDRFTGRWAFLENSFPAPVALDGDQYPSVEHAYQAAKTLDLKQRRLIQAVDAEAARRLGRTSRQRPGWQAMRLDVMRELVSAKFRDQQLRARLLETREAFLVEGNDWGDTYWGVSDGWGENHLGVILMRVRAEARAHRPRVQRVSEARLPTPHGEFRTIGYRGSLDGCEHLALVRGDVRDMDGVLVRLHSECFTGDVLSSLRCDCGLQLDAALRAIAREDRGVMLYLRGHEGRGIGLLAKLDAYRLQDEGQDTVDANLALGLPVDSRDFRVGAAILADLGVSSVRLLSNNPDKVVALQRCGVTVTRVPLLALPHSESLRYLRTKRDRMGHLLPGLSSLPSQMPGLQALCWLARALHQPGSSHSVMDGGDAHV